MDIITLTPETVLDYGFCGYKDAAKHVEMRRKGDWYRDYYSKGLRINILMSPKDGSQGMIEFIPGEFAHRPVSAKNLMFIHCLFVGYRKEYKNQGYGTHLIQSCIAEAEQQGKDGVAVVTRKGSFMAKRDIFLKNGFTAVDQKKPDFELLALALNDSFNKPKFLDTSLEEFSHGLYILRSSQCPYTEKNVRAMVEKAAEKGLDLKVVDLLDHEAAQRNPSPFGSFALIADGEVLSYHPISATRFDNIIRKYLN